MIGSMPRPPHTTLQWPLSVLGHLLHRQAMAVQGTPPLPPVLQRRATTLLPAPTTTVTPRSVAAAVAVHPARPVLRLGLDAWPEPMDRHGSGLAHAFPRSRRWCARPAPRHSGELGQTDNGREFDNHAFCAHLSGHGVSLRLSCPYTSSQNGEA
jgi:hypothetical protein